MYRGLSVSVVPKAAHISGPLNQPPLGKDLLQPPHTRFTVGELGIGRTFACSFPFSQQLNKVKVVRFTTLIPVHHSGNFGDLEPGEST